MMGAVRAAPRERQLEFLRGHPDLAGKAARAGAMTDDSKREQASVGLDSLSEEEFARFHRLNDAYKAKFGFPFMSACAATREIRSWRSSSAGWAHDAGDRVRCGPAGSLLHHAA